MEEPAPELQAGETAEQPDFESLVPVGELVRGERTRDDFFDAVLALDSPQSAREVADRAGHGVDAAREYLDWFERMGIVRQVEESPAIYGRNQEYLDWRRVQRLREEYTDDELIELLERAANRDDKRTEQFGTDSPESVSITRFAAETDQSVGAVWEEISEWRTVRRQIAVLERALTGAADSTGESRPTV
jgi:predicted ArsR family transcriptional regulator